MLPLLRSFVRTGVAVALLIVPVVVRAQSTATPLPGNGGSQSVNPNGQQTQPQSTDPVRPIDPLRQRERELERVDPLGKSRQADPLAGDPLASRNANADPEDPTVVTSGKGSGPDLSKEYTGPAVLTRGYTVERPSAPENVKLKPYVGVSAAYDSGLASAVVGPNGVAGNGGLFGTVVTFGVEGRHYWRHDIVQVNYAGNVSRYSPSSIYDGSNHLFSFGWTHLVSRRIKVSLLNNTSHYSTSYSLTNPVLSSDITVANINLATTPNIQIFDNSTTQVTNTLNLTYQKTSRLSFNLTGAQFVTYRNGNGLLNVSGWQAGNDAVYRVTRKTTVGAYYSHSAYVYSKGVGDLSMNTVGGIYSYALNARTELHARVGLSFLENLGITSVSLDPVIAALLGQTSAAVQFYSKQRTADISASLNHSLRGSKSIHLAYNRGTTPGNGVFVTSTQQVYDAGFNALLFRKFRVSVGGGRNELVSVSQTIGQYTSESLHFGVSRSLARNLQSDLGFDYRHFEISETPLLKNQFRITLGITWTNSEFPAKVF